MIDVDRVRAETPGCADHIHLNNAGASLPPSVVLDAQLGYLQEEAIKGGYETAAARAGEIEQTYHSLARLIGADPAEIALTSNATESWQLAFHSFEYQPGDRILVGEAAYASNFIAYLKLAKRTPVSVEVIPSDPSGQTSPGALETMLDDRVRLIALTHIPTNGGLINPAGEIGAVARVAGVPFLLDACQSVGQVSVDVGAIGCSFLSATGRKFLRGPRGTGFLFASRNMLATTEPPFLDLHGAAWTAVDTFEMRADARRYENWEFNLAGVVGLGAAADYALNIGIAKIEARVIELGRYLRDRLAAIPGVTVHDVGARRGAIVTFSTTKTAASNLWRHLAARGITVSVTTPASTRLDAARRGLPDMVRASVHYFTTVAELDALVTSVAALG